MLTKSFIRHLEQVLSDCTGGAVGISGISPLGGGSINAAVCLQTNSGDYFMKYNHAARYPVIFQAEVKGLELLQSTKAVGVPGIITYGIYENESYLLLEMIHPGKLVKNYYEILGHELAALHKNSAEQFGLDHDNYIGSLPQINNFTSSGCEFMIGHRFRPLVEMAFNERLISTEEVSRFEKFYRRLPELLPNEKPSLLHGDLWSGNVIAGPDGKAWLIDPAVYYGYRETDIAMTKLFGGFDETFYSAYNSVYPLVPGWEQRVDLFQLYPLLVHLNLFGRVYLTGIGEILRRYSV